MWHFYLERKCSSSGQKGSAFYLLHAGIILLLIFDFEDGGNVFLENVCSFTFNRLLHIISQKVELFKRVQVHTTK
jgi:hypothetical protein